MQSQPNFNLDRTFFIVISELPSGSITQVEMDLDLDRKEVLEAAKEGQFDTVLAIIECNPVEGSPRIIKDSEIKDELEVEDDVQKFTTVRFPNYQDPNREHRISNFEAGTGRFGPYGGRAA